MLSEWRCQNCRSLLGTNARAALQLKNKAEKTIVTGTDYIVTKVCRRCQHKNVIRCGDLP